MKNLVIISIIVLSFCTLFGFAYALKYKKQVKVLNNEINKLNNEITEMSSENNKLVNDKDFAIKQYQDLKSTKDESELIDVEVQECMKSCNYTTACMNNCVYDSELKWEKEIDKNIKLLEKIMDKEQIELLHDNQKKWIIYKDAQQKLNGKTIGTKTGTIYTNVLAADQVYIIELRAKELKGLYSILSEQ